MRGVVVKIEDSSALVLFNNGRIGRIPAPPGCKKGMVLTVRLNKRLILFPAIGITALLILGGLFGLVMINRGLSPEEFCRRPFADKNIVIPNNEYPGYEALFAHIGKPLREFSPSYPAAKNADDAVRGFNYDHYNIITYYDHRPGAVMVFEINLNSKTARFTGNFSIGDGKDLIENYFSPYMKGNKKGAAFSYKNNDLRFTMEDAVLTFKFNGKDQLTGVVITRRE
jgi:hypothetical protein